jgi:hypothetical protein
MAFMEESQLADLGAPRDVLLTCSRNLGFHLSLVSLCVGGHIFMFSEYGGAMKQRGGLPVLPHKFKGAQ